MLGEELRENGRNDMKGFEERFPDSKKNSGSQMVIARKEGWREALKWFHKEVKRLNGEEGYHLIDVFKLDKVIRQELEDSE